MKTNYLLLFLMLSFLLSCEGDKIDFSIINRSIKVNARIDGAKTRATNDTWSEGDAIGIYMKTAGETLSGETILAKNAKYVTEGNGNFSPATVAHDVKFPMDGTHADFVAYYPHQSINANFEYSINVADQSDLAAIDLLYANNATGLNKESTFVDFSFSHQLSKIIIKLKTIDESMLADPSVTIKNSYTRGYFSLVDQSRRVTSSSKANISMKMSDDGTTAEAIVMPTENLSNITFEVINGLYGYVYNLSNAANITKFEPGHKYTYTITLDTRGPISATATISDWLEGPNVNDTIVKDFKVYTLVGAGTQDNPYTIKDARNISPVNDVWVRGYIVGYYAKSNLSSFINSSTRPQTAFSVLAIAANSEETVANNTFPVQLPSGIIRTEIYENYNDNFKKEIKVKGNIASYYGTTGIMKTSAYEIISATP